MLSPTMSVFSVECPSGYQSLDSLLVSQLSAIGGSSDLHRALFSTSSYLGQCDVMVDRSQTGTIAIIIGIATGQVIQSYNGRILRIIQMIPDLRAAYP